jgi:hypothetical protein
MGFENGAAVFNCGYGVVLDLGRERISRKRIVVEWD